MIVVSPGELLAVVLVSLVGSHLFRKALRWNFRFQNDGEK